MVKPSKVTVSAGGIVVNPQGLVLLIHQNETTWSLPKGHVEPAEDPIQAASREIMEESGVAALDFVRMLGVYGRYKIGNHGGEDKNEWKIIIFFLFKTKDPHSGDILDPQARWVHCDEVENLLTHPKDKAFFRDIRLQIVGIN